MKLTNYVLAATLLVVGILPSCAGPKARSNVLLPTIERTWVHVQSDVDRGLADGVADGDIDVSAPVFAARKDFAPKYRYVIWAQLRPWAERGIDDRAEDGEIGPGVVGSLRERVVRFTEAVEKLNAK